MARGMGKGKGLDALLPKESMALVSKKPGQAAVMGDAKAEGNGGVTKVKVSSIEPNRNQPRKKFDEDALAELADSIKEHGLIQPIVVQDCKDHYMIVAGERRWRASKMAGLKEVPVIIGNYTDQEIAEISLLENLQREDLNDIEVAQAYKQFIDDFGWTQDELAEHISKSRSAITNTLRLLKLCDEVQEMLVDGMITAGHARALLVVEDPLKQHELAMRIFDEQLNVRDAEKLVKNLGKAPKQPKADDEQMRLIYENYAERLKQAVGTKVTVNGKGNGAGSINIEFYNSDDLERIADQLQKGREA